MRRAAWTLVLLAGCADAPEPSWKLTRVRPVGARVEAEGDARRASPRPGEPFTVRWFVAGDGPPPPWRLSACAPREGQRAAECADAEAVASGVGSPLLRALAPAGPRGLIAGEIGGTRVELGFDVGTENQNPTLAGLTFDGAPWPEGEACDRVPRVAPGGAARPITATFGDREAGDGALQLSHLVTAGALPRQFTVVEADAPELAAHVEWTAPPAAEIPPEGRIARFTFVLRDGRGGADAQTRAVCVRP